MKDQENDLSSLSKNDANQLAMVLGIEHNGRPFGY